jgi:hypothetical protein
VASTDASCRNGAEVPTNTATQATPSPASRRQLRAIFNEERILTHFPSQRCTSARKAFERGKSMAAAR